MWRELTITSKINKSNNPIGFFDSGVGGLTILSAFREILPNEDCIFFGDTKNMPYGEKTKEQLIEYSTTAFKFFENQNVKAVVMACNTTSAMVYEELKDKFNFKLYPLIQTVTKTISSMQIKKIGVFATPATVNSHTYKNNLSDIEVKEIACPMWVKFVEDNQQNTPEADIEIKKHMQEMLSFNPDKIILGCTHYPYLINQLSKYANKEIFINPSKIYVNAIFEGLKQNNMLNPKSTKGYDKFFVSKAPEKFISSGSMFYDVKNCNLI